MTKLFTSKKSVRVDFLALYPNLSYLVGEDEDATFTPEVRQSGMWCKYTHECPAFSRGGVDGALAHHKCRALIPNDFYPHLTRHHAIINCFPYTESI